jgi:ribosomal protein L35AE/L33A
VTGTNATSTTVNGLYTIFGTHTYPRPGTYRGEVTVTAGNSGPVRAGFTVNWP